MPRPQDQIESVYVQIGRRISELRTDPEKKRSQEDLATLISLTRTSIANIERGRQRILVHTLIDLARALEVDPAALLPKLHELQDSSAVSSSSCEMTAQIPNDLGDQSRGWIEGLLVASQT